MRTTVDIDEDVLQAARELATMRKSSVGKVLSDLARRALQPGEGAPERRNGVPILPPQPGERLVTLEQVNRLRDDDSSESDPA